MRDASFPTGSAIRLSTSGRVRKEPSARPDAPSFLAALAGERNAAPPVRPAGAVAGRVALLPFANVSGTEEHEWVGVGLADTLGHELRRSEGITLADSGATDALAQEISNPRELGERLGAEWVVLGSFQVAGPRLRITRPLPAVSGAQPLASQNIR